MCENPAWSMKEQGVSVDFDKQSVREAVCGLEEDKVKDCVKKVA